MGKLSKIVLNSLLSFSAYANNFNVTNCDNNVSTLAPEKRMTFQMPFRATKCKNTNKARFKNDQDEIHVEWFKKPNIIGIPPPWWLNSPYVKFILFRTTQNVSRPSLLYLEFYNHSDDMSHFLKFKSHLWLF